MVELIAKTPCAGLLPITHGQATLTEVSYDHITSVAALRGQARAVSAALKETVGVSLPSPNRSSAAGEARAVWVAPDTALICGPAVAGVAGAAVTDQSDGWAIVRLTGPQTDAILARLVPIDLQATVFKRNHTARTMLGHMTVSITRIDATTIEVMAMRSMAQTLVHDITTAMRGVAARG